MTSGKDKKPDYSQIYIDIIEKKFPHKRKDCMHYLNKEELSFFDVLELNKKIFGTPDKEGQIINQKHRAYKRSDIRKILNYQKKHALNNTQLALHFNLSRNTVAKWRKYFLF